MQGIGKHTDYAARVLIHLAALETGACAQVGEIAEKRVLPAPFVRRVVARLAAAGLLRTRRGSRGGVRLARPPGAISLLDVVRAMEGGIVLNRCVSAGRDCPLGRECPVQGVWAAATFRVEEYLDSVTIAELAKAHGPVEHLGAYDARTARGAERRAGGS
jgi:Rrf2 family transcriptional regulator, iron-sulfur cluster assembly transcription factor